MRLILGTVQFGIAYGINGRSQAMSDAEVGDVLDLADHYGIDRLDTAPGYGDIEQRLQHLLQGRNFKICSKIPSLPMDLSAVGRIKWVTDQVHRSQDRLGNALDSLLFHSEADLLAEDAADLFQAANAAAGSLTRGIGVSAYSVDFLAQCKLQPRVVQLPGNALDQQLLSPTAQAFAGEIDLRSAFLQGLLLMPLAQAGAKMPNALPYLQAWHAWCEAKNLPPLHAALAVAKGFGNCAHCLVGVDSASHLEAIAQAWQSVPAITAPQLACDDAAVIDPRQWRPAA